MVITSIQDAEATLPDLIKLALAGEEIILGDKGSPLVRLTPLKQNEFNGKKKRQPGGSWKGKVEIANDFDNEDDEIVKMFEGGNS